ncbi:MAG: RNA polymerase sigma factor [Myxococcales bacterium]
MTDFAAQPNSQSAMRAAAAGDFTAMYQREYPYVGKVLIRLGVRAADREDVAHDVFVAAFRGWSRFNSSRPVRPWLFGIAFRIIRDRNFKFQNRFEQPTADVEAVDGRNAEEIASHREALQQVESALASLELERRAVLVMHDIDETPMPQIAESLGLPLNTAYSRLRLARRDFNEAVARLQKERA